MHCESESFKAFWTKSQKRNIKLICPKYWNKIWIQIWNLSSCTQICCAQKTLWSMMWSGASEESREQEAECIWYCWTSKQIISHQEPFSGKPANISSYSKYLIARQSQKSCRERRYLNATKRWCISRGFCKMLHPEFQIVVEIWKFSAFQLFRRIQILYCVQRNSSRNLVRSIYLINF